MNYRHENTVYIISYIVEILAVKGGIFLLGQFGRENWWFLSKYHKKFPYLATTCQNSIPYGLKDLKDVKTFSIQMLKHPDV